MTPIKILKKGVSTINSTVVNTLHFRHQRSHQLQLAVVKDKINKNDDQLLFSEPWYRSLSSSLPFPFPHGRRGVEPAREKIEQEQFFPFPLGNGKLHLYKYASPLPRNRKSSLNATTYLAVLCCQVGVNFSIRGACSCWRFPVELRVLFLSSFLSEFLAVFLFILVVSFPIPFRPEPATVRFTE
jgi:hypothetical protein